MLEKQFEQNARKGVKPSPSAVPVGFQPSSRTVNLNSKSINLLHYNFIEFFY